MRSLFSFIKKEWLETVRSGKIIILLMLFVLLGVANPAIAKLTPWMMELMADSLAKTGMIVTEVQVDALTSWTQFFKNIPMGLISFILIYSSIFTKEYQSGTLVLMLTKGLLRYKVVFAKAVLMLFVWTVCYWICFAVTYGYTSYFGDNGIVSNLFIASACWWLFGAWVISLMVLFSVMFRSNTVVLLAVGGTVLAAYLGGMFPPIKTYMPTMLMNASSLVSHAPGTDTYVKASTAALLLSVICMVSSVPVMNKKQI